MKKILFVMLLSLGIFSMAQAQRGSAERPSSSAATQAPPRPGAQPADGQQMRGNFGGNQVEQLKELLTLTDDQVTKIEAIMQNSRGGRQGGATNGAPDGTSNAAPAGTPQAGADDGAQAGAARGGGFNPGQMDPEAMQQMREQMQARIQEQENQIKEVLTPEQVTKYDAYLEERSQQMGQGGFGGRPQPQGED